MSDPIAQFVGAIADAGLRAPSIVPDGKLHRFASNGDARDKAGWYVFHLDGLPAGAFGDFRSGLEQTWRADIDRKLSPQEMADCKARVEAMKRQREAENAKVKAEARKEAVAIWDAARPAPDDHPYLALKGVKPNGLRVYEGCLVVPMIDDAGTLHSLHYIAADGAKRFLTGGRVAGCFYQMGEPREVIFIGEGFATMATVHEVTGHTSVAAINKSSLLAIAQSFRRRFPAAKIVLCADDDWMRESNPGLADARAAAAAAGGVTAVPEFSAGRGEKDTDFNDMARVAGRDAVLACIQKALHSEETNMRSDFIDACASGPPPAKTREDLVILMNGKYCWLDDEKAIFDLQYYLTRKLDQVQADMAAHFIVVKDKDGDRKKIVTAVHAWLSSQDRLCYAGRRFKPGQEAFVDRDIKGKLLGGTYVNLWRGWGCEPVKGNVEPFMKLVDRLCGGTEGEKNYLVLRLAFKIQKPWIKVPSFVLIVTDAEGSGKSQLVKFVIGLYGQHGKIITDREMESSFDDWRAKGVLCVGCEEVSFREKRSLANRLKAIASMEVDHINPKGQPAYHIENYFDLLFTANNHDALYVRNERERRPFIVMHDDVAKMSKTERDELQGWYDNGGKEALLHYLMHEVDCSDFDPYEDAPLTSGKREMAEAGRTTAEQFVADMLQDAKEDAEAGTLRCQLRSFTDISKEYCGERVPDKRDEASLSKALGAAGSKSRRPQISGKRHSLYPVVNLKKWAGKTKGEWADEYTREAGLRDAEEKKRREDEQAREYYGRR